MGLLKKTLKASAGEPRLVILDRPEDLVNLDATWEFLTSVVWDEDGSTRVPGTVLIFRDAGLLKVMLNDKDGGRVAFGSVEGSDAVWGTVEAMLLSAATDWRRAKPAPSARK